MLYARPWTLAVVAARGTVLDYGSAHDWSRM